MQNAWLDDYNGWLQNPPRAGTTRVSTVAPPPPVAPAATIGLTPGYTPDYLKLIQSDPSYLAYKNSSALDVQQAAASRREALRQLVVRYGGLPSSLKDGYGDVDQATLDLAKGNQFSDTAQLQRNYTQGVDSFERSLAARGMLQSSDLQAGLDNLDYGRAAQEYDLGQQFGNAVQTILNNYLQTETAARRGEAGAISQAEANVYGNPLYRPTAGTSATLVDGWQTKYGVPVYQGADGSLWALDSSGNPVPFSAPTSGQSRAQIPLGDVIAAMQTPEANAWREAGQRGEYQPLY